MKWVINVRLEQNHKKHNTFIVLSESNATLDPD